MANKAFCSENGQPQYEKKMKVNIKTPKEKKTIEVKENISGSEFKIAVGQKFEVDSSRVLLFFAGKIVKDTDTLVDHKIKNGVTVHAFIQPEVSAPLNSNIDSEPQNRSESNTSDLLNLQGVQLDNIQELLNNSFSDLLTGNTEFMQNIFLNNPQVQELIDHNPEINHMLNNPALMRQTLEYLLNPTMMQEALRHSDQQILQMENLPGGFNNLQQMHTNIEEAFMNTDALFTTSTANTSPFNPQQGVENREPLPNPWISTQITQSPNSYQNNQQVNDFAQVLQRGQLRNILLNSRTESSPSISPQNPPDGMQDIHNSVNTNIPQLNANVPETVTVGNENPELLEERFLTQLEMLDEMGFTNRMANIQVLLSTNGDVSAAIENLLQK